MQVSGHIQQVLHKVLVSALDAGEWLYTARVAKVLGSEVDASEWSYTAGVAQNVSVTLDAG